MLTVQGAMPREKGFKQMLCADIDGYSLHVAARCGAADRQAPEKLRRYITRPALANERVQTGAAGQVELKLKTPWRDGTTHLVLSPLEFMQLPIEWLVCGGQIHWSYVCRGSVLPVRGGWKLPLAGWPAMRVRAAVLRADIRQVPGQCGHPPG